MIQLHIFLQLSTLRINTHKENGVGGELYSQKMQASKMANEEGKVHWSSTFSS